MLAHVGAAGVQMLPQLCVLLLSCHPEVGRQSS